MSMTKEQAERLHRQRKPIFGWVVEEDGLFVGPDNFAEALFLTPWFQEFAERTSSSYSIIEYVRTVLRQRRERQRRAKESAVGDQDRE